MTNDFEIKTVRKQLNAFRTKHGAQSEVGQSLETQRPLGAAGR